jgi:hypothetical protein
MFEVIYKIRVKVLPYTIVSTDRRVSCDHDIVHEILDPLD